MIDNQELSIIYTPHKENDMLQLVQWDKIKNGFRGFEKLAYKYVSMNYPNPNWEKTQDTRDGNKDATAVFFGYQSQVGGEEQWWMEAKYSSCKQVMTRYRLDSTIVSAILESNVKKIIFVTNISISAKTITDIRHALYHAIRCEEVIFCTKYTLEYWLSINKNIYKDFFDVQTDEEELEIAMPSKFVIQQIEYYSEISNKFSFKEPLRELFKGEIYTGYFEIFSPQNLILALRPNKHIQGLTILSETNLKISVGENPIHFSFKIENNYQHLQNGRDIPPSFFLGDLEILSARDIIPSKKIHAFLKLKSQENLINSLGESFSCFLQKSMYSFQFIEGVSGCGKSYILDCVLKEILSGREDVFYAEFFSSTKSNFEVLINLLLFILFPYLDPLSVDYFYLNKINNNYISSTILSLIENKNDIDIISQEIDKLTFEDSFFASKVSINKRIIILDDLQKLSSSEMRFLAILLIDIHRRGLPIYFIGAAQPDFFKNASYGYICQNCVTKSHIININMLDVFDAISLKDQKRFYLNQGLAFSLKFNMIEILIFSKYILENDLYSNDFEDFILTCKIFQQSKVMERYIVNQFNNFFELHSNCRKICDQIYWSCHPYIVDEIANKDKILLLIENGLVKYNYDALLIPVHDIYKVYYRAHFKPTNIKELIFPEGSPELLQYSLNYEIKPTILNDAASEVYRLLEQNKFYSVLYILQGMFEQTADGLLRNRFETVTYYKLYYAYGLAAKHQSTGRTGFEILTNLYGEISEIDTPEMLPIVLETAWELAISHYERLEYKAVQCKIQKMYATMRKMQANTDRSKNLSEILKFHDALMLDTLVRANKNDTSAYKLYIQRLELMRKKGFIYRAESFRVRYALTLSTSDIHECLKILKECREYFKDNYGYTDKYYLWSCFHYSYYTMILEHKSELIDEVVNYHDKMKKQYYANYRGRINGMATYYYSIGEIINGNRYLLMETEFENDLQARQKAFHYETVALHEMLLGNYTAAMSLLEKAANLFSEFKNYQKIPFHNIAILENTTNQTPPIVYWWGGELKDNVYYIDSRCVW